jgi:probable HAF family extracellular repeat protein
MKDLGTLPGFTNASFARGVNNTGQVVGESDSDNQKRAFVYSNGRMTDLTQAAVNMRQAGFSALDVANGVNNQGWIAGFGTTLDGRLAGFLAIPVGVTSDPPGGPDAPAFTSGDVNSVAWTGGWFAPLGLWSLPLAGGALYWSSQHWHHWPRAPWHTPPQKPHWQPPSKGHGQWPTPHPKPNGNPNGTPNHTPNPRGTPNQFPGGTPRQTPSPNPGMTPRPPWIGGNPSPSPSRSPRYLEPGGPSPSGNQGLNSTPAPTPNHLPTPRPTPNPADLPHNAREFYDLSHPNNPYAAPTVTKNATPGATPREVLTNPNPASRHQTVESQEAAKANGTPYHRPGPGRAAQAQSNKAAGAGVIKSVPEPGIRIEHHTGTKTGSSHTTSHKTTVNRPKPAVNKSKPAPSKPKPTPKKK